MNALTERDKEAFKSMGWFHVKKMELRIRRDEKKLSKEKLRRQAFIDYLKAKDQEKKEV